VVWINPAGFRSPYSRRELFTDYMGKPEMQELVSKWLGSQVYERLSSKPGRQQGA